jgi:hypothetical protein
MRVGAIGLALWASTAALAQTGDGTISSPYTREMPLPGKMGSFSIINPGKIARPVCARNLHQIMQSAEGKKRLPDRVYDTYGTVSVNRNPNRLNFETVHYMFGEENGVVLTMSCTLDANKAVSFSVEAYGRETSTLDDIRAVVDGHFRYFGAQLSFRDS